MLTYIQSTIHILQ